MDDKTLDQGEKNIANTPKREVHDSDKTCGHKWATDKLKNVASLVISFPLESGQLERWYSHLGAS